MKDSLERCHCASSNCYCANIKRAENKITALYNRHLEKAGITRGQYALLANIERNPGISVSALAETMDLERTTPFPLVKDIVGYLKMCHSILPIKR